LDEADFQTVNIHEGIDSTLDLVSHQMKGKIDVIKNYGPNVPEVACYPNQLNQVFMNLLVNASQAIDDTGTITITTESVGEDVTISVQDTGRGISAENLDRIFNPGFTTKGVGVGTGLGLSISYKIIEDHRGRIEVESSPGNGTKFTVTIPARRPDPEAVNA
jgi:two-component system NtrC family sensor kinase